VDDWRERDEFTFLSETEDSGCNFYARSHSCIAPVNIAVYVRPSVRI
jgi:hypothetical protein